MLALCPPTRNGQELSRNSRSSGPVFRVFSWPATRRAPTVRGERTRGPSQKGNTMLTTTTWGNRRRGLRRAAAARCLLIGAGGWLALGSAPALADSGPLPSTLFSYPDFTAPSGPGLNLIASAQISASALQLDGNTDVGPNTGAAWYANQVDVQSSWESQFTYQVPASGGAPEGLAFVIQGQSAAADGEGGPNLGFAGIT